MRRPGRRIEVWQINSARGEVRKKGPDYRYAGSWDPKDVTEVEVKLETDDVPFFRVYGPDGAPERFDTLEAARKRIADLGREFADAATEEWREVVHVETWRGEISAFGHHFTRVLVAAERVRRRDGDGYGAPQPIGRRDYVLELPIEVWAELEEFAKLDDWFQANWARPFDRFEDDEGDDEYDPDGERLRFLLRYLRGRARLLRDLRDSETARVPR